MTRKEKERFFELAEKLYCEEVRKSGMTTIPFCYIENHLSGGLIVFSAFCKYSDEIKEALSIDNGC